MPKWTPEQQAAIEARNHTILVSAAAGSGKTAVLVERIIGLIREGAQLNRMLIVTFTKAAAAEMRQRLSKRLTHEASFDREVMGRALDDLESTDISTIHAFCQKVIRSHFQVVGVDPLVRVCDDQMKNSLFEEAFTAALDDLLNENVDQDLTYLAENLDQNRLLEMTKSLYDFLMSLPRPFDWLMFHVEHLDDKPYAEQPWYQVLRTQGQLEVAGMQEILGTMRRMLTEPEAVPARLADWQQDALTVSTVTGADPEQPMALFDALRNFSLKRATTVRKPSESEKIWLDRYKKQRDKLNAIVKKVATSLTIDEPQLDMEFSVLKRQLRGLQSLVTRTHTMFLEKKAAKNVMDFADMEQFTLQIMEDPDIRAQLQGEYDHIFVDECQDVSQVQDAILQDLHGENACLFMVGDVKQSIYRFRKADPTLFLGRMQTFSDDENALERRIFLQKNFRSRGVILDATNIVFRDTMRAKVTELDYKPADELICGRDTADESRVEVHLLDISPGEDGEKVEALEAEAKVVAERIKQLREIDFDDGNGLRKLQYRDMVILLAAAANTAPRLVELLTEAGIPTYYDGAESYFALPEVRVVKALLSVIDNPKQDIPLLSTLKMTPFSFTDVELGRIRGFNSGRNVPFYRAFESACGDQGPIGEKCRMTKQKLQDWRFDAEVSRLSDFIWQVMTESGFYAACGALPRGELRQANLRMLYQRAQQFEQEGGIGLSRFLTMMQEQERAGDATAAKILGENEDLVRIMTMHKSKGLEFPVVFLMQMSGKMHRPQREDLLLHTRLGLTLPYINPKWNIRRRTQLDEAFKVQRLLDEKAERARLLYVAMTRARERLELIGCRKGTERDRWALPVSDYRVWTADSMLDWVMGSVMHRKSTSCPQNETPWNIQRWGDFSEEAVDKEEKDAAGAEQIVQLLQGEPMADCFTWNIPVANAAPLKTSVSALAKKAATHDPLPLSDAEESADTKASPEEILTLLRMSELPARPAFLEERRLTAAERGILTHRLMSLLPLTPLRNASDCANAVKNAAHALVEQGIFPAEDLLHVNMKAIAHFFESNLGRRMTASPLVRREWPFNLRLDKEKGTLLQGVIDCAFLEEGEWVLVDYKTDTFSDNDAFIDRYREQLRWYARALEEITGRKVKERWLVALRYGRIFPVDAAP